VHCHRNFVTAITGKIQKFKLREFWAKGAVQALR
jgi:hypothetical protein